MRRLSQEPRRQSFWCIPSKGAGYRGGNWDRGQSFAYGANYIELTDLRGCIGSGFYHNPQVLIHRALSPLRWRLQLDELANPGAGRELLRVLACPDIGKLPQFSIPQLSHPKIPASNAFHKQLVWGLKWDNVHRISKLKAGLQKMVKELLLSEQQNEKFHLKLFL